MSQPRLTFAVDSDRVNQVGLVNPASAQARQLFDALGLNSQERLFYSLVQRLTLSTCVFEPGRVIASHGAALAQAHLVVHGEVDLQWHGRCFTVGPGAVIGLAEGIALLPMAMGAVARTTVRTSAIPIDRVLRRLPAMHKGLRAICRGTVSRILPTDVKP